MRLNAISALILGAALLLAGCAPAGSPTPSGSADAAPVVADLAFTGQTIDGAPFDGTQLAGKPTVLWFWTPWCPTCRAQSGGVTRLAREYAGQVNVVGVGGLADVADIRDYARRVAGPLHLVDPDGALWRHFGVTAQSTYVVLDAGGAIVIDGYLDDRVLADRLAELAG